MLTKLHTIKISTFLLLILLATAACGGGTTAPAVSVDDAVAMTVAASAGQTPTLSVDEIVALTVAASAVEPVAAGATKAPADTAPAQPVAPAAPDTADANTQPVQAVADPNTASGTPQLRVNLNANVRKGPGTNYPVVSSLSKDSVVNVVAKTQNDTWYIVELPGGSKGWIANSVTDPVNAADMAKVQVAATIPAPPTSTPTATATATTAATSTATTTSGGHTATPHGNSPTHTPTPAVTLISPTAAPSNITVRNNSGTYICYVLTAASGEGYGSNHLNGELAPGNDLYITYPDAGPYELYAQECEGYDDLYWAAYNIFNDYTWELAPGGDDY